MVARSNGSSTREARRGLGRRVSARRDRGFRRASPVDRSPQRGRHELRSLRRGRLDSPARGRNTVRAADIASGAGCANCGVISPAPVRAFGRGRHCGATRRSASVRLSGVVANPPREAFRCDQSCDATGSVRRDRGAGSNVADESRRPRLIRGSGYSVLVSRRFVEGAVRRRRFLRGGLPRDWLPLPMCGS